jgi:dethiobiotin synthetase
MGTSFFITGTDTDAGKTFVTAHMLRSLAADRHRVVGLKPIASGFERVDGRWRNEDVDQLTGASSCQLPSERVNRYAFEPAIAPHLAAAKDGVELDQDLIAADVAFAQSHAEWVLVEGVGGWHVPLSVNDVSPSNSVAGLAVRLGLPVILVVAMRLGCLNHALLTVDAIKASGLPLAGWVANHVGAHFECATENRDSLIARIEAPLLFEMPYVKAGKRMESLENGAGDWIQLLKSS